jgi:hypothetical protein
MKEGLPTVALSIRQPWAWLIVNGYKDIENRTWPTVFRGPLLIHASKTNTVADFEAAMLFVESFVNPSLVHQVPDRHELAVGGLVGVVDVVDCVRGSDSPWFTGADSDDGYGFVLANPRPIDFIPYRGRLGFFNMDWGRVVA